MSIIASPVKYFKCTGHMTPCLLGGSLIFSVSKDWITIMKSMWDFDVIIEREERLHFASKQVIKK